jgi:hypothetical protein
MRALLAILVFLVLGLGSDASAQVQLLRVDNHRFGFRGVSADVREALIKVQNIAFEKRVPTARTARATARTPAPPSPAGSSGASPRRC